MQLKQLSIKNFRCFEAVDVSFDEHITVIHGRNGVGKTSILEAIHYLCYLKSFRTHLPRELIRFDADSFFVRAEFVSQGTLGEVDHTLQVGFQDKKRIVKLDNNQIKSYKEIIDHLRVVTLTEDDLDFIKAGPDIRRAAIDQYVFLHDPAHAERLKAYRAVLANRNALFAGRQRPTQDNYRLWTTQAWEKGVEIAQIRSRHLVELTETVRNLYTAHFDDDHHIDFVYSNKRAYTGSVDEFLDANPGLYENECRFVRTLYGPHLDDIVITLKNKRSRSFASRGQQKLLVLLFKVAQIKLLTKLYGKSVFLLDDFMTDFDDTRLQVCLTILKSLNCQLIITSPIYEGALKGAIGNIGQVVSV